MAPRTRIGKDGNVIKDGEENNNGAGGGRGGRRCRLPDRVDTFGFSLEPKHFAILLLFIALTMGTLGLSVFASFLFIYTYYQRHSSSSGSGGGGGARWKDGRAVGSNIKGVGDLPKPPKGG